MKQQKFNPLSSKHHPGRHSILTTETRAGIFVVDGVECDDDQAEDVRQLTLMKELASPMEFNREQLEALRSTFQFRSVKFGKSESLQPPNVF
jgi:hypothetical protein